MMPASYDICDSFVLRRDLPQHGVSAGQVGAVVDEYHTPRHAYEVEFVAEDGSTIAQFAIDPALMAPMPELPPSSGS